MRACAGVELFLQAVAQDLRIEDGSAKGWHYSPNFGRAKPLLLVPVIGTGDGGFQEKIGHVLARLMLLCHELANTLDVDISIVTRDKKKFDALQTVRALGTDTSWHALPLHLQEHASTLVRETSEGNVALFLGAGVSASGGLPLWRQLLEGLAKRAGMSPAELAGLAQMDPMDAASVICVTWLIHIRDITQFISQIDHVDAASVVSIQREKESARARERERGSERVRARARDRARAQEQERDGLFGTASMVSILQSLLAFARHYSDIICRSNFREDVFTLKKALRSLTKALFLCSLQKALVMLNADREALYWTRRKQRQLV